MRKCDFFFFFFFFLGGGCGHHNVGFHHKYTDFHLGILMYLSAGGGGGGGHEKVDYG